MEKRTEFITATVYESVKNDILLLRFKPGEKLSESQIAAIYGISRTPVRAVFQRLEAEQYLTIEPQRGTFVTLLDDTSVESVIFLRYCMEKELMAQTAQLQNSSIFSQLSDNLKQQYTLLHSDDFTEEKFDELDHAFHNICYCALNRTPLQEIYDMVNVHYTRFRVLALELPEAYERNYQQHQEIFNAMYTNQLGPLQNVLQRHLVDAPESDLKQVHEMFSGYFISLVV